MMLVKLYGEVIFSKLRIGAEDARAPIATCGYFSLNHAASTAIYNRKYQLIPQLTSLSAIINNFNSYLYFF